MTKAKTVLEIKCATCGKSKKVIRYWAKYCSARCKSIGWAIEAKAKMK